MLPVAVACALGMLTVAQRAGRGALAGLLVGALAMPARLAAQELGGMPGQRGMDALAAYASDPFKNRRVMHRLESRGTEALPPVVLIALADARLRSGQPRAASRLFEEVLA